MTGDVLVTGATGFIGSRLCRALDDRGWDVTGTSRAGSNTDRLADLDVDWARVDVRDRTDVADAVAGHDRVFHLAGVGLMDADPGTVRQVNAAGTRNVLEACRDADTDRLVFVSTAGTRRSDDGLADEDDLARPIGAYQTSKRRAEAAVDDYVAEGYDAVTAHPTSVFGPGDTTFTARLLKLAVDPKLLAYLPGGVSIVGVDDVVDGLIAAMERGTAGEHYVLGGENLTYGSALEHIARYAGTRPPPFRIPPAAIHTSGPIVGAVNRRLGTRVFPVNAEMARLVTQTLFYSSAKAARELDYSFDPFESTLDEALNWYARRG